MGAPVGPGSGRPVTGVLLAAGPGTRLGRGPKALLASRGVPLVSRLVDELRAGGCAGVVVVLGARAARVRAEADLAGCTIVENPLWSEGMGGSFRTGIGAVPTGRDVLVALVDQPGLDRAMVRRLLQAHVPGRVTAAGFAGGTEGLRRGHPVLFAADAARTAAAAAEGDAGARGWLARNPGIVDLVDCSDLSDGGDVDTAADLWRLG
ncbi:4-diphosphocytidyl-2C-methyl-D-erythritol synthase [Zafaria cholistanensis]|uniref:4-diphosphocytidyl-2C-methyl-D-erythritol synthase n=1 Tax=Zafaria cholistanensis TaxID=1682741 RepID=A0A5A7NS96_9MICC|nr:NTP transferase domain-containing protein [Zafaria cholistanensis]GER22611.1 4-diphosphocytidyl-2C-methyl-D-erythritol synthase [Zafaria cholistanensis]